MEMFGKNPIFFPAEKSVIFLCKNNVFFCVEKYYNFLSAILYWTADSGQRTVDSGQAILYWTGATRDSWTVDGTEWTEALSLL